MTVNELIENMVKTANIQEKSACWLSQKQVKFLADIGSAKQEFEPDRRWSKRLYIDTNKYNVVILVSPLNGAGYITVNNQDIINKRINAAFEQKEQENKAKIAELETELKELYKENEKTDWTQYPENIKKMIFQQIEKMENELKQLRGN